MALLELLIVSGLSVLFSLFVLNGFRNWQDQRQLENAFYQLLKAQNGCLSLIELAATARVDAQLVKQYLEEQVQNFEAVPEVDEDGDMFYRFPKLRSRFEP